MGIHEENVSAIVNYFESGIKQPGESGRLGIEIEHIVVDEHSNPISYDGEYGVRWILEQLETDLVDKTYGDDGMLLGLAGGNKAISLEPAAQFELSAGPYEYPAEFSTDYQCFQKRINQLIGGHGRKLIAIGYHPTAASTELTLIPKERYRFMDAHFAKIGPFGRCMMRGSAATQISIDYYSEQDCIRKLRIASAATPLLSLLCDNTPIFEGKPRTHHMMRTEIWQKCDPARCNAVSGVFDPAFSFESYAEYILRTPAIFAYDHNGKAFATELPFDRVHAVRPMELADVEHALSMFFNDARLKTYVEIRPADSMPVPFAAAYAALIKGLFYSADNLDMLDGMFEGVTEQDVVDAKESLMANGYEGHAYGKPAAELLEQMLDSARHELSHMDAACLNSLTQLVASRKTLAMMEEKRLAAHS